MRRSIIALSILCLIFIINYLVFITTRSTVSTLQGYDEIKDLNQENSYIANIDPSSDFNWDIIDINDTSEIYNYLNANLKYALFTEGFMVSLPNTYDMEVSFSYLNKEYYELNKNFRISDGKELYFDYSFNENSEIPVWVGNGLSETYPLGSTIEIVDPVINESVTLKVQGVLEPNISHSNLYSLSSKQYYNFTVLVPVNKDFIDKSDIGFQLQGLLDIILIQTSRSKVNDFGELLYNNLGAKFNFYTQEENFKYFNDIFFSSIKTMLVITIILLFILFCISVWSSLSSVRLMIKDFTINIFVGLRYSKLRKIIYGCYGIFFLMDLVVLLAITVYSRNSSWLRKDASFCTFGILSLIEMDWISLLTVMLIDIFLGVVLVEIIMWKIKKVPISLGVMQ